MVEKKRSVDACRRAAESYRGGREILNSDEKTHLGVILAAEPLTLTLDDALGLMDPTTRTKPPTPVKKARPIVNTEVVAALRALDELIHEHRAVPVMLADGDGEEKLLGNLHYGMRFDRRKPVEEQLEKFILKDVWLNWYDHRPAGQRNADGFEIVRMMFMTHWAHGPKWLRERAKEPLRIDLKYNHLIAPIIKWIVVLRPMAASDFLLDQMETLCADIPPEKLAECIKEYADSTAVWRRGDARTMAWRQMIEFFQDIFPGTWTGDQHGRLYRLARWMDEPGVALDRFRPRLECLINAFKAGHATEADIYDQLLGPRTHPGYSGGFDDLHALTALKRSEVFDSCPALEPIALRCRERILEIELARGDTPTVCTGAASALRYSGGLANLVKILAAMESSALTRNSWDSQGKAAVFSHLVRVSGPADGDTVERFKDAMAAAGISQQRLVEVAFFAPHWARHVEAALGWPGAEDAVWWVHAHTKDRAWRLDVAMRNQWEAHVRQRTALTAEELLDGAVDVAWFHRVYGMLGKKRWAALHDAARFASGGAGHVRARLFADAMLGLVKKSDLVKRVSEKRSQDALRALGLLPLPAGVKGQKDLLERYQLVQEFIRGSRKFGSIRQTSERRAAAIALENLARTAGYSDPLRLQWAMETRAVADLAAGPVVVTAGEVSVTLAVDDAGTPEVTIVKKGKPLAALPAAARKNEEMAALVARKTELKRMASRMRGSLEAGMCRGDPFTAPELRELLSNPMLRPLLEKLVFVGEGILGYPVDGGRGLIDHAGKIEPIKPGEKLRLAHCHDLLATGRWSAWQRDCFLRERVQPFKQVFRELYVLTETEKGGQTKTRRYAGHQVQPRQALALLGGRGWVVQPEMGVFKTYYETGITAWLEFQEAFFTPADVEGLTLEAVTFTGRNAPGYLPLEKLPPRLFSETMRDLDLVVSVAHRGGVDPEASASTVEMRRALLGETNSLLRLDNVRLEGNHALIKGQLGEYTVHLGSAVTHKQPGGALYIVAVHSQHRGRLFLPFADDDPKTAEVISKVLLLARDQDIKDPNVLQQIRNVGS